MGATLARRVTSLRVPDADRDLAPARRVEVEDGELDWERAAQDALQKSEPAGQDADATAADGTAAQSPAVEPDLIGH